jgi:ankyrin repeat protein
MYACQNGHLLLVQYLISQGAELEHRNKVCREERVTLFSGGLAY